MSIDLQSALRIARMLIDATGVTAAEAVRNPAIPESLRDQVLERLDRERILRIRDPNVVEDPARGHHPWLHLADRASWYYWARQRQYMIDRKGWPEVVVRSIDRTTDTVLAALENPVGEFDFRTRGLIVGYVQSGKTANYSALIAKAADCGYRLIIVLSGIHNSLRQQTQRRLTAELVGLEVGRAVGVGPPPAERQWHTFTSSLLNGDFNPGLASATALFGPNPVLIVAKKWVSVLTQMIDWFNRAQRDVVESIPTLIIDDEADQASVNTGGDRPLDADGDDADAHEVAPSRTNELVRRLVNRFHRVAYVAYTATPFANILIDPNAIDNQAGEDLYPRSFIIALPKPPEYYGAEEIFGLDPDGDVAGVPGLDVIRRVRDTDIGMLVPARRADVDSFEPELPQSLIAAIEDFILAGAARIQRGDGQEAATMLIHTSYRRSIQGRLTESVVLTVERMREQWRYFRSRGVEASLRNRWEEDFRRVTRSIDAPRDCEFDELIEPIGVFFEQLQVRQINSGSLDELDYEREPSLKVIVIGGNRLSRGLTLEGLLVSYYVRAAGNYDTLMQMGRWFGYRNRYVDLTRIYTTERLEQWFRDLATVELEVREDIRRYELESLTPLEFGVRIRRHPAMMVTSPLKMQHARTLYVSFSGTLRQTINFPFENIRWLERNLELTKEFLSSLGAPDHWRPQQPMWMRVTWETVVDFLNRYEMDESATQVKAAPMLSYIRRQAALGELTEWVVAVMGQSRRDVNLGQIELGIQGEPINAIKRTRVKDTSTLKAITSLPDQEVGLHETQLARAEAMSGGRTGQNLRAVRDPTQGLLLVYPISRFSGHGNDRPEDDEDATRVPIFVDPEEGSDVIGVALVFPKSNSAAAVEYVTGAVNPDDQ